MLVDIIKTEMIAAWKSGDMQKKTALSLLVDALNKAAKEKKAFLTNDEENTIILKMQKQIKETIDSCPDNRLDIKNKAEYEYKVISEFAPKLMSEEEINNMIDSIILELQLPSPIPPTSKGVIMKNLMPKVKGKADGKLVNTLVAKRF